MPFIEVSMQAGKPAPYREAIMDSLYEAMREALNIPEGDHFIVLNECDPTNFRYGPAFGVNRSDDLLYIRMTVFNTRSQAEKIALFRSIASHLGRNPGIASENVFVVLIESAKENWSVGHGIAQFV